MLLSTNLHWVLFYSLLLLYTSFSLFQLVLTLGLNIYKEKATDDSTNHGSNRPGYLAHIDLPGLKNIKFNKSPPNSTPSSQVYKRRYGFPFTFHAARDKALWMRQSASGTDLTCQGFLIEGSNPRDSWEGFTFPPSLRPVPGKLPVQNANGICSITCLLQWVFKPQRKKTDFHTSGAGYSEEAGWKMDFGWWRPMQCPQFYLHPAFCQKPGRLALRPHWSWSWDFPI